MKNNSNNDKEIAKMFYDLYYVCMKYNDENQLSKNYKKDMKNEKDIKNKKEIDCGIYMGLFFCRKIYKR